MFVILFGGTAKMGKGSRDYFVAHGFELVEKYTYTPDTFPLPNRFEARNECSKEEVEQCDFVYSHNERLIGFKKEQIIDAVQGKKNCLLTTSAESIEYIRQIKAAYGDYVTVIGAYMDDRTLDIMFKNISNPPLTDAEFRERKRKAKQVKEILLAERKLFDHIVMYGGEDSTFNLDALESQYAMILKKSEYLEKKMNNKMYVELPYTGSQDFIFISYSHKDSTVVYPILHKLQFAGFRVWYDNGIEGGDNWRRIIASKIEAPRCKDIFVFVSNNSIESEDVQAEINLALDCSKKISMIKLDDSSFDSSLNMYLSHKHFIMVSNEPDFEDRLFRIPSPSTRVQESE